MQIDSFINDIKSQRIFDCYNSLRIRRKRISLIKIEFIQGIN